MNKRLLLTLTFTLITTLFLSAHDYSVYIDKKGNFRRSDTKEIMSFYGVNYTLPFAHAYRAINYVGKNHKEAINKDVYHMARLGLNAYRIHLWDVEIADSEGNLIENDHLELFDYLISELEKRDIHIIITAQTNFGNGYPERNIITEGYSYKYEKCKMHYTEECVKAQENYAKNLAKHINKYTGKSYSDDNSIIAIEINNEPCHSGTAEAATAYINRMVKAFRDGGFKKPILYNVSHNIGTHTQAFFNANIQGTTYQWYPTGLVSGHERLGNFLPNVDLYNIPFSNVKNFDKMAKVVYEFDPGDVLCSYLYPAVARSFRSAGFQWITQFAYDPIDIAWANTEYQTHYLNLAYTPNKAIGMKIAAEVVKEVNAEEIYPKYPQDTIFGDFRVSYVQNLSEYNNGKKFFYTNKTNSSPKDFNSLEEIAGVSSSTIVDYKGTGVYFIDKIGENLWRLEVMPDVFITEDPFKKPSLDRKVAEIVYRAHEITLHLPNINDNFKYKGINTGNTVNGVAENNKFNVSPGVYIIGNDSKSINSVSKVDKFRNMKIGEYVAPEEISVYNFVLHKPIETTVKDKGCITINAQVVGTVSPDSVVVYPKKISFWNERNKLYKMDHIGDYDYSVTMPINDRDNTVEYNIVVFEGEHVTTYPQGVAGTPLSWDFNDYKYYKTTLVDSDDIITLVKSDKNMSDIEIATIPDGSRIHYTYNEREPMDVNSMTFSMNTDDDSTRLFLRKYVGNIINDFPYLNNKKNLCVSLSNISGTDEIDVALITKLGITYRKRLKVYSTGTYRIGLSDLTQDKTALIPAPYPVFLTRWFEADESIPFSINDIEQVEVSTTGNHANKKMSFDLVGLWIE